MEIGRILHVHQESDSTWVLARTLELARRAGARVTLAGCAGSVSADLLRVAGLGEERLERAAAEDVQLQLEAALAAASEVESPDAGAVVLRVLRGRPFFAVIREVVSEGYDLVVVAAPGGATTGGRIFPRSLALHLVRKCPAPVWLIRPGSASRLVGVALEAGEEGEGRALDRELVAAATAMARVRSASLALVHVLVLHPSAAVLRHRAGVADDVVAGIAARAEGRVRARLEALAAEAGMPAGVHVLHGRPAEEVPRFAERAGLELLVMGTVGRTGVAGLLIGNTAEDILQQVTCPVLALKPEGFVSPVV